MGIREDARHTLRSLASYRPSTSRMVDGLLLQELTDLDPGRLNDAVDLLAHDNFLKVERAFHTQPFNFLTVQVTVPGRLEAERLSELIDRRWKTFRSIGEGGQGRAFLVQDTSDRSEGWVLKRLINRERLGRFEREIGALQALRSDHIPSVRGYSLEAPAYIVTPYLGKDLKKHPRASSLNAREILEVFRQIVTGIADAHAAGVVHRDIKPNNIVLSENDLHAYVIDFGICQYADGHLRSLTTDEPFGNPAFAAPECLEGREEEPTAACDVYSLGKVLYWLGSKGGFINRESLTANVISRITTEFPVEKQSIVRLIQHCVQADPLQRPSIQSLLEEVNRAQAIIDRSYLAASHGSIILVDRFDGQDNFSHSSSRSATTPPQGNPPGRQELAVAFIQPMAFGVRLESLVLALSNLGGSGRTAHVALLGDKNGEPNDNVLLEHFTVLVDGQPRPHELLSQSGPRLEAGARYWMRLSVDDPNSNVAWWSAPPDFMPLSETFAERFDIQPWRVATSSGGPGHALRVTGRTEGAESRSEAP